MKHIEKYFAVFALLLFCNVCHGQEAKKEIAAKFAPPAGKVLVFAGQDNASVGGTKKYSDGYVDNIGVPAGITHYIYFSEGWTNNFKRTFAKGSVAGLNSETEWAAGPMCQKYYMDSETLDPCVMHVSIAMEGNCEDKVADGTFDHLIKEFADFVEDHPDHPFMIRIGYEFDGSWNGYDSENFKKAFIRIVDALRARKLTNYVTVLGSSSIVKPGQFEEYDPGGDYVDWIGYSWWGEGDTEAEPALTYARKVGKPVMIAESTARGHFFNKGNHEEAWDKWFEKFFKHIDDNKDVIRAVSYINADWDSQDMWDGWGMTRIESAPLIKERWLKKMAEPQFINGADNPFDLIQFEPGTAVEESQKKNKLYQNSAVPVETRIDDLLRRMTLAEKAAQLTGWWDYREQEMLAAGDIFTPEFWDSKCPLGIGDLGPLHNLTIDDDEKMYAAVQKCFASQRLGIPAILHDEASHGFMRYEANSFPTPIGLSCSWNPDLMVQLYSQAGQEARARGVSHILSPVVDVARDLRWGRVDETMGEDPFLVGRLGSAMVRGLQGSDDGTIAPTHVAATLKHFAGYAGTEGGRNRSPYPYGPRYLLDNEVAAFRYVIQNSKPASVMAAFNEIDGLPCHINPWMLKKVLRDYIGFEGLVVGDYQGVDLVRRYQKIGTSDADAGRRALESGLQLELPNNFGFKHLPGLVEQGKVDVATVDAAVREVLELKFKLGLFEAPAEINVAKAKAITHSDQAKELAIEAARQSIVLLRNEGDLLPLTVGDHKKIAVIGPNANVCRLGNYSGKPNETVSLFEGIAAYVGEAVDVVHAEGCKIANNDAGNSYDNWRIVNDIEFTTLAQNQPLIDAAVDVANSSDLVVLALGENVLLSREAWDGNHIGDRTTFDLTESQQVLARSVLATGKPVVLFLTNSKPVTLHELGEQIPAILTGHYAGQAGGTAAAEILFGKTNPSGKLTLTWPRSVGHLPAHYSQHASSMVFDYVDSPRTPVYPFGYGLSYTTFEYGSPSLSAGSIKAGQTVEVSFDVTNSGQRAGAEIAQLYVSGESFDIARPALELKGFSRVSLEAGQTKRVTITLDADDLHFHNMALQRVLPNGVYQVRVGRSSGSLGEPVKLNTIASATENGNASAAPSYLSGAKGGESADVGAQSNSEADTLKEAAAGLFEIGAGVSLDTIQQAPELVASEFGYLTPENCMKPQGTQPTEGLMSFGAVDDFFAFANENNLKVVGHALVWAKDDRTPAWFYQNSNGTPASKEELLNRMQAHIRAVVERYGDAVDHWDVVNEALDDGEPMWRDSGWLRAFDGATFIVEAFKAARAADPDATLIYNDYRCELPGKREKLFKLIDFFKEQGAPVDAIGLQGHYEFGSVPYEDLQFTLDEIRKRGLKVIISEVDIDVVTRSKWWEDGGKYRDEMATSDPYPTCPMEIETELALQYGKLFEVYAKNADIIDRVTLWGLHDGSSWLNDFPWQRTNHPLLFDRGFNRKPAYRAVIKALQKYKTTSVAISP